MHPLWLLTHNAPVIFLPAQGFGGLTQGNLTNLWDPAPGYIDFYILGLDAPSRLKGGDLDKNGCL